MDKREFKKAIKEVTEEYGFKYVKKGYYYMNEDLIIVIDLQKSDFEDGYYLNYGFLIKELHPDELYPKSYRSDMLDRLVIEYKGESYACVHYNDMEKSIFKEGLKKSINMKLIPMMQDGIEKYLELFPDKANRIYVPAKDFLGL